MSKKTPELPLHVVSIRIVSGLAVIPEGYWNEVGKLLWELEAAEAETVPEICSQNLTQVAELKHSP